MPNNTGPSNVPGMDYILRIGKAWADVMTGQAAATQKAWNEVKAGTYDHKSMMQAWASAAENYFGAIVESSRGPGYVSRPAWVYFTHKKGEKHPLERSIRIDRTESLATNLQRTDFASMQGGAPLSADSKGGKQAKAVEGAYENCTPTPNRNEINIKLDLSVVDNAPPGQYMSFIFGKDRGAEPPLVIVMLRVET